MAVKKIVTVPNSVLTTKAQKAEFNAELKEIAQNLLDTLEAPSHQKGAGIAAPQIGILQRICIAKKFTPDPTNPDNEIEENFILVNPEITSFSDKKEIWWEGCLSIPDTYGEVERYKKIRVKAYDLNGKEFSLKAEGLFARIIQHEIDHLDGILFTTKTIGKTLTEKEIDKVLSA